MTSQDLLIAPFVLLIIYGVAFFVRNKYYADSPLKKYFIPALNVKIIGAIATGLIYFYYYGDGDTINYYNRTKLVHKLLTANPSLGWRIVFANTSVFDPDLYGHLVRLRAYDESQFMVVRLASILSLPAFGTYTGIALFFAGLSFSGIWMLFKTFVDINPKLTKEFAIACLFIPSVFFWGSGLFKDTVAIGFMGWFTYSSYMIFIRRKNLPVNGIFFIISIYMLAVIKKYIIMGFMPAMMFWILFKYRDKIKNNFWRVAITPMMAVFSMGGGYLALNQMGGSDDYWSVDNMQTRAKDMQWWHKEVKNIYGEGGGGSFYSIGSGDFSTGNLIRSFPLAVNVTFFRPYLWEVRNPVMLLAAIESLILLVFTLKLIFNTGLPKMLKLSIANPEIFFCLLYSVIFAFAVGFTSFNFGALVRYKIPCIPFFVMALYMLRYYANMERNKGALEPAEK